MKRRVALCLVLGVALLALTACARDQNTPSQSPTASPAAESSPQKFGEFPWRRGLYVIRPDGTGLRLLMEVPFSLAYEWSPDGRSLAVAHSQAGKTTLSFVSLPDGSVTPISLPYEQFWGFSWSPDGSQLAVSGPATSSVALLDVATHETKILDVPDLQFILSGVPEWAPDGDRLLLPDNIDFANTQRLLVVSLTGSLLATLGPGRFPAWSPDGRQVAFWDGQSGIYVQPADGSAPPHFIASRGYEPIWSPDGRQIAFEVDGIRLVTPDGSDERLLTQGDSPAWSPQGTHLAFTRDGDLFVINRDGSNETQLTDISLPFAAAPSWSPDGQLIAFLYLPGSFDVYVADADGGNQTLLVPGLDPHWSPDGDRIAFLAGHGGLGFSGNVYVMRPDGSAIVRLPATIFQGDVSPSACANRLFDWSADSTRIRYCEGGSLWSVAADGSGMPVQLVEAYSYDVAPNSDRIVYSKGFLMESKVYIRDLESGADNFLVDGEWPTWSQDERYVAYFLGDSMYVIDLASRESLRVATAPQLGSGFYEIAWSPAEPRISYSSAGVLYVADVSSDSPPKRVAEGRGPVWSPDGKQIAYYYGASNEDIYVVDVDENSEPRYLTKGIQPSWSPDGVHIAFARITP